MGYRTMSDATPKAAAAADAKGNDAVWPFFALYAVIGRA
jgi:hypothetical protein